MAYRRTGAIECTKIAEQRSSVRGARKTDEHDRREERQRDRLTQGEDDP